MVAFVEGRPQHNQQQLFQAVRGPGFGGDPSLAKIIEQQRFNLDNGNKFGHAAHQVIINFSYINEHQFGQYKYSVIIKQMLYIYLHST